MHFNARGRDARNRLAKGFPTDDRLDGASFTADCYRSWNEIASGMGLPQSGPSKQQLRQSWQFFMSVLLPTRAK
jgi:hypothetical protein